MKRLLPLMLTVILLVCGMSGSALAENKFYFDKNYNTVFEGEDLQLVMIRQGDCAEEGDLSFKTSNKKVATVDEYGVVNGLTKGTATITATLKGAKRTWTAQLTVTVARRVETIEVTGSQLATYEPWDPLVADALDPNSEYGDLPVMLLRVGKAQTITATCKPADATNRKWILTSSDDSIVRASGTTFTGRSAGECLVTVQSVQNPEVYQAFRALVVQPVTSIRLSSDVKSFYVGETVVLDAVVGPDNATITLTVKQQAEEIRLKQSEYTLKAGNYVTLAPTVLPDTTNDKTVVWSSSDPDVAKVSSSGRVTAVNPGVAIITCESKTHPEVYAQAVVSVYQPVTKIAFTDKSPYVAVGEEIQLNWTVTPDYATDTSVTFSTNKESILRVDQNGVVTGLKRGEAYVYATANDGSGKKGSIKVQVVQPVEGVGIKYDERTVGVGEKVSNTAEFYPSDASITNMTWTSLDETIATVSGSGKTATVTGRSWGETTIIGVTEDGGYVTTFQVKVGDENKPLNIVQLYVEDEDTIRIQVYNESDMTITRFYFIVETYDAWGNPVVCNDDGRSNDFEGYYAYTLEPGAATRHGRFTFGGEWNRPESIGMVTMRITAYRTEDGNTVYIPRSEQEKVTWKVKVLGE